MNGRPETGAVPPGTAPEAQPGWEGQTWEGRTSEGHAGEGQSWEGGPPAAWVAYQPPPPDRFTAFMTRLWHRSPRWAAPLAILGCFAGATTYALIADPTHVAAGATPTCLLKYTTGLDCPGCGGTRAFWYLIHGNIPAAARHHAVFVFAVPFLIYAYVAWAGNLAFRWRLPQLRVPPVAVSVFLAAWLGFSVLRNLPWAPFTWFFV